MAITVVPGHRAQAPPLRVSTVTGPSSAIFGLGINLPDRVVANDQFAEMGLDTSDAWIVERTGIMERRLAEPGTSAAALGEGAARRALAAAGVNAADVDLILVSSTSPDGPTPSMACRIQESLGAVGAIAMDILAACSGFVYGLSLADAMISSGRAETALVISAEVMSRLIDWKDRPTSVLFADGAGAAVLCRAPAGCGFLSWCLGADGRGKNLIGVGKDPRGPFAVGEPLPKLFMHGPEVFKFATEMFARQARAVTEAAGLRIDDIDLWVPHQANLRIIETMARRVGVPMERVIVTVDRLGNTSSSTIPLALGAAVSEGRLHSGDKVVLLSVGAGLTWGACMLQWA